MCGPLSSVWTVAILVSRLGWGSATPSSLPTHLPPSAWPKAHHSPMGWEEGYWASGSSHSGTETVCPRSRWPGPGQGPSPHGCVAPFLLRRPAQLGWPATALRLAEPAQLSEGSAGSTKREVAQQVWVCPAGEGLPCENLLRFQGAALAVLRNPAAGGPPRDRRWQPVAGGRGLGRPLLRLHYSAGPGWGPSSSLSSTSCSPHCEV